jgi:hypothetical protein
MSNCRHIARDFHVATFCDRPAVPDSQLCEEHRRAARFDLRRRHNRIRLLAREIPTYTPEQLTAALFELTSALLRQTLAPNPARELLQAVASRLNDLQPRPASDPRLEELDVWC